MKNDKEKYGRIRESTFTYKEMAKFVEAQEKSKKGIQMEKLENLEKNDLDRLYSEVQTKITHACVQNVNLREARYTDKISEALQSYVERFGITTVIEIVLSLFLRKNLGADIMPKVVEWIGGVKHEESHNMRMSTLLNYLLSEKGGSGRVLCSEILMKRLNEKSYRRRLSRFLKDEKNPGIVLNVEKLLERLGRS